MISVPNGILEQPKNTMPRIDQIWAFLSVDSLDGNEGVIAMTIGHTLMPMVAANPARLKQLEPMAESMAKRSGVTIKLVKFTAREEIKTIEP